MNFKYKARSSDGKIVEGTLPGESQEAVAVIMRQRGLFPIRIEKTSSRSGNEEPLLKRLRKVSTIPLKDKVVFFRQLSAMINAGVTLGNSLDILSGQTKSPRLADAIRKSKAGIDSGLTFSESMKTRSEFTPLMVAMVGAGEEGGVLDKSIERLAVFLDKQDELRRKVVSAVTYPTVVILFAFVILYLLVTVVMPRFSKVFQGLNVQLPRLTLLVFDFSNWMATYWYIPALGFLLFLVLLAWMNKNATTRPYLDRELPGIPELIRGAGVSRGLPLAAISRGLAGVAGRTLIINLPGQPKAIAETLEGASAADGQRQHADESTAGTQIESHASRPMRTRYDEPGTCTMMKAVGGFARVTAHVPSAYLEH